MMVVIVGSQAASTSLGAVAKTLQLVEARRQKDVKGM